MTTSEIQNKLYEFIKPTYPDIKIEVKDTQENVRQLYFVEEKFAVLYPMQRPYPYKMIAEDEVKIEPTTFYRSDIEFGDKHTQSPLLFATEDILEAFKAEGGRIFFETAENGRAKVIDCKGKTN